MLKFFNNNFSKGGDTKNEKALIFLTGIVIIFATLVSTGISASAVSPDKLLGLKEILKSTTNSSIVYF